MIGPFSFGVDYAKALDSQEWLEDIKFLKGLMHNDIQPTEEQKRALTVIKHWYNNAPSQSFRLGGYAGTGKTTVIKLLIKIQDEVQVCVGAFTGKACMVLNKKGVCANTLHSLMYNFHKDDKGVFHWTKREWLNGEPDLLIVDEASMVSTELLKDLMSFGVKILFVGDPGQLEPVGENPKLMENPEFTLQTIHRQAEDSGIIKLANHVRKGGSVPKQFEGKDVTIRSKSLTISDSLKFDQVICGRNETRKKMNIYVRRAQGLNSPLPQTGDKIIVLRNNPSYQVVNGSILFVLGIEDETHNAILVNCQDEIGNKLTLPIWTEPFHNEHMAAHSPPRPQEGEPPLVFADFAYFITCHKAQGSEWDNVCVWDEPIYGIDPIKWRYTAITRAAKNLTYLL